jgi:signal transduction histidine kinase
VVNVAREALANVARHACATRSEVAVTVAGGHVEVDVTDDGVGIGEGEATGGRGLRNMLERAQRVGGTLAVAPAPSGRGTRVAWRAPVRA